MYLIAGPDGSDMWFLKLLDVVVVVVLDILPPLLDTGLQVWNGIQLNNTVLTKNAEWGGCPCPPGEALFENRCVRVPIKNQIKPITDKHKTNK